MQQKWHQKSLKFFSLLISCSILSGCGYQWRSDTLDNARPTLTVSFVENDEDGRLTNEIISALTSSGVVKVVSSNGLYHLHAKILGCQDQKIGFRVDPQKVDGKVRKNLLSTEGRRTMILEASLCQDGEAVYGPFQLEANSDYDYVDGDSIQDLTFVTRANQAVTVLPFSLGQLEAIDSAQLAANEPLYRRLAKKVVNAIIMGL